jgi:hypothetical protein
VELGNGAMQIAKTLLRAAVTLFESVLQQIMAGQGWGGSQPGTRPSDGDDDEDRETYCKKKEKKRKDVCDEDFQEAWDRAQRIWESKYPGCEALYYQLIAQGRTEFEAKRAEIKCKNDADNVKRQAEQEARKEWKLCYQDAEEKFRRCMRGED